MKIRGFITHKKAEAYADCQDFFAVNSSKKSVAVADGMAQSIFPDWWAQTLVQAWCEQDWIPQNNDNSLSKLRQEWRSKVEEYLQKQKESGALTYLLENRLRQQKGAGATLCAIKFEGNDWRGYVLGDTCLIEIDSNNNITNIYRSQEGEFINHPDFFDSIVGGKGDVKPISGTLSNGHILLMATDALAELLYERHLVQEEAKFIEQILYINSHEQFCNLVDAWRDTEKLHNDDTTLLIIEDDKKDKFTTHLDDLRSLCKEEKNISDDTNSQIIAQSSLQEATAHIENIQSEQIISENNTDTTGKEHCNISSDDIKKWLKLCYDLKSYFDTYDQNKPCTKNIFRGLNNHNRDECRKLKSLQSRLDNMIHQLKSVK